jgi:hypothetical protein
MNIITFYNDKINKEFPILQKKVFQKYKQDIKQILIKDWVSHGKHIDDYLNTISDENEIIVLFDIDCIPLNEEIIIKAVKWAKENIGIYSMSQTAKYLNYPIIHSAPAFMVFSIKTFNKLGRPSFLPNKRSDCGAEMTWSAREKGIDVFLLYPSHCESPHTKLENGQGSIMFGHGTTYGNSIYHAFESRFSKLDGFFINKCKKILS